MSEIAARQVCKDLSKISNSEWIAIKFKNDLKENDIQHVRFCEAVTMAFDKDILLFPHSISCDGAKRTFGWIRDFDSELSHRLSAKIGINVDDAAELVKSVPVLPEFFSGIMLSKKIIGDIYISYLTPGSAMKFVRALQKSSKNDLCTQISSIMSVCGNIAVRTFLEQRICVSFGCPDSREYGGIRDDQLVIGIPYNIACRIIASN